MLLALRSCSPYPALLFTSALAFLLASGCDSLSPSSELSDSSISPAKNQSIAWSTLGDETAQANVAGSDASGSDAPYTCSGRVRMPEAAKKPWRSFVIQLHFPPSLREAAEDEAAGESTWTRTFEVRATDDPESRLLLAATCRIPASEEVQTRIARFVAQQREALRERVGSGPASGQQSNAQAAGGRAQSNSSRDGGSRPAASETKTTTGGAATSEILDCGPGYHVEVLDIIYNEDGSVTYVATCVRDEDDPGDGSGGGSGGSGNCTNSTGGTDGSLDGSGGGIREPGEGGGSGGECDDDGPGGGTAAGDCDSNWYGDPLSQAMCDGIKEAINHLQGHRNATCQFLGDQAAQRYSDANYRTGNYTDLMALGREGQDAVAYTDETAGPEVYWMENRFYEFPTTKEDPAYSGQNTIAGIVAHEEVHQEGVGEHDVPVAMEANGEVIGEHRPIETQPDNTLKGWDEVCR